MTYLDFYRDLCRGKGSCYLAMQEEPDRYRNMLMHGATCSTAFDQQCEGTRAAYIHELLSLTSEIPSYIAASVVAFREASPLVRGKTAPPDPDEDDEEPRFAHNPNPTDEDFHFIADLLALFAKDGDHTALTALIREYDTLFCHLRDLTERPDLFFPARDDFEQLAITLVDASLVDSLLVLSDIGKLYQNPIYKHYDFDQLHELVGIPSRERLKAQKDDPALARYLAVHYPTFSRNAEEEACRHEEELEDLLAEFLPSTPKTGADCAHRPPQNRISADPHALMAIVDKGEDEAAIEDALLTLSKHRHPDLHDWALSHLESDPRHYLPILMKNYGENNDDAFEVWYELKQITVDPNDENGWHGVHHALLDMKKDGFTPPEEALLFIYRNSYCSICRLEAIKQLYRAKALTADILAEALYDANPDTRALIRSFLAE